MTATFPAYTFKNYTCDIIHSVYQKYVTTQGKLYGKNKQARRYNMGQTVRPYRYKGHWNCSEKGNSGIKCNRKCWSKFYSPWRNEENRVKWMKIF
jgi:hypothetical protein